MYINCPGLIDDRLSPSKSDFEGPPTIRVMGIHLYDSSTDSLETQDIRLKPARVVTKAQIPCLVWAEDALSFVHCVPTCLFALQLLVPDENVELAASAITTGLPYRRLNRPDERWLEYRMLDKSLPSCFPRSIALELVTPPQERSEDDPPEVFIHPQSYFHFDVRDQMQSISLVPPLPERNSDIRFPTLSAFFDTLIATILEPTIGYRHWKLTETLRGYVAYLFVYHPKLRNRPRVLANGSLEPERAAVLESLKKENQPCFEYAARGGGRRDWIVEVRERRDALERMG